MTIGQKVAKMWKAQYFDKRGGWATYKGWELQPEQYYIVLRELKTEKAVLALLDKSWLRDAKKEK